MSDASTARLLSLFFCEECVDTHGSNPQSVSCYCKCHHSIRDEARWLTVRRYVLAALRERADDHALLSDV